MKILAPMAGHIFGLHDGHRALLKWGKQFGDVHAAITPNWPKWQSYLVHGDKNILPQDISKQTAELEKLNIPYFIREPIFLNEHRRKELKKEVESAIDAYSEFILFDRHREFLIAAIMQRLLRKIDYDLIIRGPEAPSFILKDLRGFFGWIEMKIFPKIIKDKNDFKCQTLLNREEVKAFDFKILKNVKKEIRPHIKPGKNIELIRNYNDSNKNPDWKISNIGVFEGPLFGGRVEVFRFFIKRFWLEDCDYYPEK